MKKRTSLLFTGLLLATFFHGLYDSCLFLARQADRDAAAVLVGGALTTHILAVILAGRLIRQHRLVSHGLYNTKPVLTIRHATIDDISMIRTLARQIWPQTYENILTGKQIRYMMNLIYSEDALKKQMAAEDNFIIVYNNDIPIGFA